MKKFVQTALIVRCLMCFIQVTRSHVIEGNLDTTKIDSVQNAAADNTLKNPSESLPQKPLEQNIQKSGLALRDWIALGAFIVGLSGLFFGVYQYRRRHRDARIKKRAELEETEEFNREKQQECTQSYEEMYRATLAEELGSIRLLGSPDIESIQVDLDDAFVSLHISESWRSEKRFEVREMPKQFGDVRNLSPEQVMQRAFKNNYRMLLIIGDPGSGKTTLLKYYTMCCLKDRHRQLGLSSPPLPIFLPLRELEITNGEIEGLSDSLARWAKKHHCKISESEFYNWLHQRQTLVLLDGLDEISDLNQRKAVCEWIDATAAGLKNAYFVVTSRWTGYQKVKGIEIGFKHLRADVMDFTPEQQKEFLNGFEPCFYVRFQMKM